MISNQAMRSTVTFLALAAHNIEETLYARGWVLANRDLLARCTERDLVPMWAGQKFRYLLITLTVLLLMLAVSAARAPRRSVPVYLLLTVVAMFFANAIVPHIAGAIVLGAYVPGLLTALVLVLPVAPWVYLSTIRDGYATRRGALAAAAVGTAVYAAFGLLATSIEVHQP
jgi:hypothetical protein